MHISAYKKENSHINNLCIDFKKLKNSKRNPKQEEEKQEQKSMKLKTEKIRTEAKSPLSSLLFNILLEVLPSGKKEKNK